MEQGNSADYQEGSLQELQEACLLAMSAIRDEAVKLFEQADRDAPASYTLRRLFVYLLDRSQAAMFLVSWGYAWDAEIVLRSFYEAAVKILLIGFAHDSEKDQLVGEFWTDLSAVYTRKTARKAEYVVDLMKEWDPESVPVFNALASDEMLTSNASTNKTQRKALERKWSFAEIVSRLAHGARPLVGANSLLHMYGMASHLIHADKAALDLMTDRAGRPQAERNIVARAHTSRILTDQVHLGFICVDAIRHHLRSSFGDETRLRAACDRCSELSTPFSDDFNESQREFYQNLKSNRSGSQAGGSADLDIGS